MFDEINKKQIKNKTKKIDRFEKTQAWFTVRKQGWQ